MRHSFRDREGRFTKCTLEKLFGIKEKEINTSRYRCEECGHIFAPILASGICPKCQSKNKILYKEISENENKNQN